jgi:hypothetical protein
MPDALVKTALFELAAARFADISNAESLLFKVVPKGEDRRRSRLRWRQFCTCSPCAGSDWRGDATAIEATRYQCRRRLNWRVCFSPDRV